MRFEWDPTKAASNLEKHGISFTEASTVFFDLLALTYPDPKHSTGESRFITIGLSSFGRVIFVAHAEIDEEHLRIISARTATKRERHDYQESP